MSGEDWHGACHAAGMLGLCGAECPALQDGECDIEDEIHEECNLGDNFEPLTQKDLFK